MITLYGVTSEGTSIPIEVTTEGKLVVDTSEMDGYISQGDDVEFGTVNATGKLTGTNASFSGLLDSNGLTASPAGEGVISTRSSGGIRPVWRAGDGTFIKDDGTTYTSQITAAGDAQFKGKVFSAPTKDSDPDTTLVTKGFIASTPSAGPLVYNGYVYSWGAIGVGTEYFTTASGGTGLFNITPKIPLPGAAYTFLVTPVSTTPGLSAQVYSQNQGTIAVKVYNSKGENAACDISILLVLPPAAYKVNTDKTNVGKE